MSCGNSKDLVAKENNQKVMEEISGTYVVSSINGTDYSLNKLTIQFEENSKTVSGFSGCNRFTGTYTLEEDSITFGPLASTRMACQEEKNNMEQEMITTLSGVNTFSIKGQELILLNGKSIVLKASKNSEEKMTQENNYKIEYTTVSRGLFNEYVYENGKLSILKDRTSTPTIKTCSQDEVNQLLEELKSIDLVTLETLKAPTEKRFYDGAAIATLTVTYLGKTYQTPEFDNGEPNKYIAALVSTFLGLVEKQ
jgi:heat shock protein HslJ